MSLKYKEYEAEEHVFHKGDPSDAFYIILIG